MDDSKIDPQVRALKLIAEALEKGLITPKIPETTAITAPEEQKIPEHLFPNTNSYENSPAAAEQYSEYLANPNREPNHFLDMKLPHPEFHSHPYEIYHMGHGNEHGSAYMKGKPVSASDIIEGVKTGAINPQSAVVRASHKQGGWYRLKEHPHFKNHLWDHFAKLVDAHMRGEIPAAQFESHYRHRPMSHFNPVEVSKVLASQKHKS